MSQYIVRSYDRKSHFFADAKVDPLLESQFAAGRLYAAISSRPGQSGRADGYVLEGKELEVSPIISISAKNGLFNFILVLPQEIEDRQAEARSRLSLIFLYLDFALRSGRWPKNCMLNTLLYHDHALSYAAKIYVLSVMTLCWTSFKCPIINSQVISTALHFAIASESSPHLRRFRIISYIYPITNIIVP